MNFLKIAENRIFQKLILEDYGNFMYFRLFSK